MYARVSLVFFILLSEVYCLYCTVMEVSVELVRYDTNWDKCGIFDGKCDPKFEVCINGQCQTTTHIENTNHIDFKRQNVTPNPMVFGQNLNISEIHLMVTVIDHNLIGENRLVTLKHRINLNGKDGNYSLTGTHSTRLQIAVSTRCKSGSVWTPCTRNVNECKGDNRVCKNNSQCVENVIGYDCICNAGFTGSDCENEINECAKNSCGHDAKCQDLINEYRCICPLNYTGKYCETKISLCDSSPCGVHGRCNDTDDGYNCLCYSGYTGPTCTDKVDNCRPNPCKHSADCINQLTSYLCLCVPGYSGKNCETLIDVCIQQPCLNRGICMATGKAYECFCAQGYFGHRCERKLVDVLHINGDETITSITPSPTQLLEPSFVMHVNTPNTLSLNNVDKQAFTRNVLQTSVDFFDIKSSETFADYHKTDNDISPSESFRLSDNEIPAFKSTVGIRYYTSKLSEDNSRLPELTPKVSYANTNLLDRESHLFSQTADFNHYAAQTSLFESNVHKLHTNLHLIQRSLSQNDKYYNTFVMKATHAYSVKLSTEITNSAVPTLQPCTNGATLTGSQCICVDGFTGIFCDINIDDCQPNPCEEHGTCVDHVRGFKCMCPQGFTGSTCHIPIDECLNGGTETKHAHGYVCRCAPGYEGVKCEIKLDHCTSVPCKNGATCTTVTNGYQCKCSHGYDGPHCEILPDSCDSGPCQNSGTCVEHTHGYTCKCPSGYEGQYCERFKNYCQPNPCFNGSTCKLRHHGYRCHCQTGFYGNNCDLHR